MGRMLSASRRIIQRLLRLSEAAPSQATEAHSCDVEDSPAVKTLRESLGQTYRDLNAMKALLFTQDGRIRPAIQDEMSLLTQKAKDLQYLLMIETAAQRGDHAAYQKLISDKVNMTDSLYDFVNRRFLHVVGFVFLIWLFAVNLTVG